MPLSGIQTQKLLAEFEQWWDIPTLRMFVSDHLDINLDNIAPDGNLKERALKLIDHLICQIPPRDRQLLEKLRGTQTGRLREIAAELLSPAYFSPTADPHDAILLGRAAFVDRRDLREMLREFTNPNPNNTRVLIIRGNEPCGKSYSWPFLRHLAAESVGAIAQPLRLSGTNYTPTQFVEQIFTLLGMNRSELPQLSDEPQLARIDPLINAFRGQVVNLPRPYWLVIDDLNDPSVSPSIRDTAYAIAYSVEDIKPPNLWVALLGYNALITASELRWIAQDEARFPDATLLAEHFHCMANEGPQPLALEEAREYADLLLAKFPNLDKEAMIRLTPLIEQLGEKLKRGERA